MKILRCSAIHRIVAESGGLLIEYDDTTTAPGPTPVPPPTPSAPGPVPANCTVIRNWVWLGQTRLSMPAGHTLAIEYRHDGRVPKGLFDWSGSSPLASFWSTAPGAPDMSAPGCGTPRHAVVDGSRAYRSDDSDLIGCKLETGKTYYLNLVSGVQPASPAINHRAR